MRRAHRLLALQITLLLLLSLGWFAVPLTARGQEVVVHPPICDPGPCPGPVEIADQLEIRSHRVDVTIVDQVATTHVDQVFHNPNDWVAEGTYLFPVPHGAAIGDFTMMMDGEPVAAKVLDAAEARRIYDDIVRSMRDPALLEFIGQGLIQARVFPIPPGEDREITLDYTEVLPVTDGLTHVVYPLTADRFSSQPLQQLSIRVAVESRDEIRAVYSPSHPVAVSREDDRHLMAGYEASDVVPGSDFELYYSASPNPIAANLISSYDAASGDGHFVLLAAPGIASGRDVVAKDVVVVLDTSGSMEGEKLSQAKTAVRFVLDHLNPDDRFNLIDFSTGARTFASELQPMSAATQALPWVDRLVSNGGTDIDLALQTAMGMVDRDATRPAIVLFLTDGLPTEGEVDIESILDDVADTTPDTVRLFSFGVGDDVDTLLLDSLAEAHHGASSYVRPGEAVDDAVSGFYARISAPVLTDIALTIDGVQVDDLYPAPLPDLFAGGQLVLLGRYHAGGPATVTLTGKVNGKETTYIYKDQTFASTATNPFVDRLWATRKIGYLLTQIRLHGEKQELIQAIVDLSVRYGIVTPYTSSLITDEEVLTQAGRDQAADSAYDRDLAAPEAASSGYDAVTTAQEQASLTVADAPVPATGDAVASVRTAGSRAFILRDETWIETTFDPSTMTARTVNFASAGYFALLDAHPDLGPAFALGTHVIAISDGQAYEVTPAP